MFDWLSSLFSSFLSPSGLLLLSYLDSSVFFFTPFANDLIVILLTAQDQDRFWLYALIATAGSMAGIASTNWIGRKVGEPGLERVVPKRQLARAKRRIKKKGAIAAGLMAVMPPPFPLTPLVVATGALEVNRSVFLLTATLMRILRFGLESLLARRYGDQIAVWLESPVFHWMVGFLIAVAIGGTGYAVFQVIRQRIAKKGE